jgi:hypothetical protein
MVGSIAFDLRHRDLGLAQHARRQRRRAFQPKPIRELLPIGPRALGHSASPANIGTAVAPTISAWLKFPSYHFNAREIGQGHGCAVEVAPGKSENFSS